MELRNGVSVFWSDLRRCLVARILSPRLFTLWYLKFNWNNIMTLKSCTTSQKFEPGTKWLGAFHPKRPSLLLPCVFIGDDCVWCSEFISKAQTYSQTSLPSGYLCAGLAEPGQQDGAIAGLPPLSRRKVVLAMPCNREFKTTTTTAVHVREMTQFRVV